MSLFNGDISCWDVSRVTDMTAMFSYTPFNSDISRWDVSSVMHMQSMFYQSKFDQDISSWVLKEGVSVNFMFKNCPIRDEYKPKCLQILNHND